MTSFETRRSHSKQASLPPLSLTERDKQLLAVVGECGALTAPQLSRCLFPPASINGIPATHSNCLHRLKLLTAHGYLVRFELPHLLREGRKPYVYLLAKKGAEFIASWHDDPDEQIPRFQRSDRTLSGRYLEHLLLTNDVRLAITAAVAQTNNRV